MTLKHGSHFETQVRDLAARSARGLPLIARPSSAKGARGCRVHGAPAVPCASPTKENAHEHTGPPKSPGIPARNGFTDYIVLSPARAPGLSPWPAEFLPPA